MKIGMIHILCLSVMLFLIAGCGDKDNDNGNAMDSVIADPDFMFNTSISLNIQLESTLDEAPLGNAYFEIFDAHPHEGGTRLLQARTDDNGWFEYNITIAANQTSIILYNENKDFYEFDIERIDDLSGSMNGSFASPFNSSIQDAPAWTYNTFPYYAKIFSDIYNENNTVYSNDLSDMFGCFLGNVCIGVSGGIHPGADMLPDNRVLFTTFMYLPNSAAHTINFRFYDASEEEVYIFDEWYTVQNANIFGNNQEPQTFNYGNWVSMPDPFVLSQAFPGTGVFGTLAFEDKWTTQDDYDINDFVLYCNFEMYLTDSDPYTGHFEINYKIAALGTANTIGFGIQFPDQFILSNVQSASGTAYLENGNFTLIICDDAHDIMPGTGFINTDPNLPFINPELFACIIDFTSDINQSTQVPWENIPYNPFIFTYGNRIHEIHPADYPPTILANPGLWGTGDDTSIPAEGRYYRTANNLPWCFMLPIELPYPREHACILDAYPYFDDWVNSPRDYEDWYLDEPGYRNYNYIYTPPEE